MQNILFLLCFLTGLALGLAVVLLSRRNNDQRFLDLVRPVQDALGKVDDRIQDLEKARIGAYESLIQQVRSLQETQLQLRSETGRLVNALRSPGVRGRWGEMQ